MADYKIMIHKIKNDILELSKIPNQIKDPLIQNISMTEFNIGNPP
jgi:hypothetical protein